jgi:hypothetical protein
VINFTDNSLYTTEAAVIALMIGAYLIVFVTRRLEGARPGLAIGWAIGTAYVVRVLAALGLEQTPIASELRGGDELTFIARAHDITQLPFSSSASTDALTDQLHVFLISINDRVLGQVPPMAIRFELIALAVVGLALLTAAVYELGGPRPALIAAWILALEPTGVFFSGLIHKEPIMFLAEGMIAFGGAVLWKRGDKRALIPLVVGAAIATATRPYVGWFLAAAGLAIMLHASLRRGPSRSMPLALISLALIAAMAPLVIAATSQENLRDLQLSQEANVEDTSANLALERVDYSSRSKIVVNLPQRVRDLVLRPYPWQLENTSQQLGLLGTIVAVTGLLWLIGVILRTGGDVFRRAGPLVYPALFLLVAYSLSAGNAGTAFRYRTHFVAMLLCLLLVLREQRVAAREPAPDQRPVRRPEPILA